MWRRFARRRVSPAQYDKATVRRFAGDSRRCMLLAHRAAFSRAVLLLNEADAHIVEGLALKERFHYVASATQLKLAIPQLTQREKLVLDRLMPVGSQPQATKLPFELKQTEVESYWRFYKYYPTFGEFAP